jgi:hypothetical protein
VVYGRRRVGKTFLVSQYFEPKSRYFVLMGENKVALKLQLKHFMLAYEALFKPTLKIAIRETWDDAFEAVCYKHVEQITQALGLSNIAWQASTWYTQDGDKAQIDLLIDRQDGVVTLCEIKYSQLPYKLNKEEAKKITRREEIFQTQSDTKKTIQQAIICSNQLAPSVWLDELIDVKVTLDDLFCAETA